jgi:DNA-binding response OmpR family regulator
VKASVAQRVLIVEDEQHLAEGLRFNLEAEGYQAEVVETGESALARILDEGQKYDLIVLDVMLPGIDGLALCRWIRSRGELPVIMLTARGEEADRIVGLELGADDYVTKPFSPRELAVRVRTVLRRTASAPAAAERLVFDDLVVDARAREVEVDGQPLRLTAKEFDLLFFLASNPREVFSRDQLMDRVWGYAAALDTGTVTVHIQRLRSKIERDPRSPRRLETVWGVGYRFVP